MFEKTKPNKYQITVKLYFKLEITWFFDIFKLITAGGQNIEKNLKVNPNCLIL